MAETIDFLRGNLDSQFVPRNQKVFSTKIRFSNVAATALDAAAAAVKMGAWEQVPSAISRFKGNRWVTAELPVSAPTVVLGGLVLSIKYRGVTTRICGIFEDPAIARMIYDVHLDPGYRTGNAYFNRVDGEWYVRVKFNSIPKTKQRWRVAPVNWPRTIHGDPMSDRAATARRNKQRRAELDAYFGRTESGDGPRQGGD